MSMKEMFGTDQKLEKEGIWIDFGPFRVLLARAGGANKQFTRTLNAKMRPYKRAIETETLSEELADRVLQETYAETIILDWNVRSKDEEGNDIWVRGIDMDGEGDLTPPSKEAYLEVFVMLPELWHALVKDSQNFQLYKLTYREDDVKN